MRCVMAAAGLAVAAGVAWAEPVSEVVYRHKNWEVLIVGFDDGSVSCVAQVTAAGDTFSIWADAVNPVKLQFYSADWQFGEGDTADLQVEIDRRGPWSLTNAELYQNSVLFDLPDETQSSRFLHEVMNGRTLHLRNDTGEAVMDYSLAGSSASIGALGDCVDVLSADSNPFD